MKLMKYPRIIKYDPAHYIKAFHESGLTRIEVHGILSVFLLSDPRRPKREILEWLKDRLKVLEESEKRDYVVLKRGGLSEREIAKYRQEYRKYLKRLIEKPELIQKTHEIDVTSRIAIIGYKPS